MTVKEIRERLDKAKIAIRKSADEYNARLEARKKDPATELWPGETRKQYDEANKEYDEAARALKEAEETDSINARLNQINEDENRSTRNGKPKPGLDDRLPGESRSYGDAGFETREEAAAFAQREKDKRNLLRSFIVGEVAPHLINEEMRASCQRLGFSPEARQMNFNLLPSESHMQLRSHLQGVHPHGMMGEQRALSKITAGLGLELVPTTFVTTMELAMIAYGPMLAYVDTITTDTGEPMQWPTGDDTANEGVEAAEAADITGLGEPDPIIAALTWNSWEYISKFIRVPYTLTRDSMVNIDQLVAQLIGERFGRIFTKRGTLGTGTNQIKGIVTDSVAGATAAAAAAIAGDDLINLQQSVDPAYRSNGVYMSHDNIIGAIRKLKDTTGQYLWQSNLRDGQPDTVNGRPIIPNAYMASTIATTNITVLYGDFKKYKFRRVGSMRLMRLSERFAEKLQVAFLGHISADGKLLKVAASAACPVKRLTQP